MADLLRLPISNGNCFSLKLLGGSQATPVVVLLDTGSSMSAVYKDAYEPGLNGPQAASNSFLDSGATVLRVDPLLFTQVIEAFNAVDPRFRPTLEPASQNLTQIDPAAWPTLGPVLEGPSGVLESLTEGPTDYWQFDNYCPEIATAAMASGGAPHPGQSIQSLPLFAERCMVLDRGRRTRRGQVRDVAGDRNGAACRTNSQGSQGWETQ